MIKWMMGLWLVLCGVQALAQVRAPSVVFLNPGHSDEPFWREYSRYMQDAAQDLGLELRVLYGERDPARMLGNAHEVLRGITPIT